MRTTLCLALVFICAMPPKSLAQPTESLEQRLQDALTLLQTQQIELAAQRNLLIEQGEHIQRLQAAMDDMHTSGRPTEWMSETSPQRRVVAQQQTPASGADDIRDGAIEARQDDPTRALQDSLPGAMRLPGTDAVMRWGGYVKASLVQNFDPLAITDRFIVGAIPASETLGIEEETAINVSQSRINMDLREPTEFGMLRAFIEGDFDAERDTFRLRHAFGQRGNLLVGKTWSGFVDTSASPEELDFEGLNGRINVRQGQLRWQPGIGRRYEWSVSLEDPSPKVTGGEGVSQVPDFVTSARVNLGESVHGRIALLIRQVRAQWDENPGEVERDMGWGVSLSGQVMVPWLDERDKVLVQLNAGSGYGRYVNDLNSVGDFDGVFSDTGRLKLIDVYSGYVSYQHWWRDNFRSNFTLGFVDLDNPSFVDGSFYRRTYRTSGNLIFSPIPRMDLGVELLWGERENEDGSSGDALQFQFATKFRF